MDIVYDSLSLSKTDNSSVWTMRGPFSAPLTAGFVVAGNLCIWWASNYAWEHLIIEYFENATRQIKERVIHSYDIALNVVIFTNIPSHDISYDYTISETDPSKYVIWIFNGYFPGEEEQISLYDLYEFDTDIDLSEFIQGISTICQAFNVDIGKIILACPLHNRCSHYIQDITLPILE